MSTIDETLQEIYKGQYSGSNNLVMVYLFKVLQLNMSIDSRVKIHKSWHGWIKSFPNPCYYATHASVSMLGNIAVV